LSNAILSQHLKSATPINSKNATNAGVRNYALLFAGCVLFHIAGTWTLPLIDRDEPRFAEASREMIERADYIVPYFNSQLRFDKPPLTYWAQIASYSVFGQNDFAARFPSAIAAALVALSIFAWGTRIGGIKVGWWAAIIFTLSLQTFLHGKAAVADMWLVLFMTIAHWSGYELIGRSSNESEHRSSTIEHRTSNLWWWMFYLSLAFAFLAKGPIGWVPLATVAATKFFLRDADLARRFKFWRGILFMLAIVALWGVPALIQTHGEFFTIGIGRHVVGRSLATMEGHGAKSFGMYLLLLPFYFVTIFISFFPWAIKLPWLTRILWRSRRTTLTDSESYSERPHGYVALEDIDRYLIAGAAIIFIIFSLIKTKLPHYTLPAFPLLALLLGRHWSLQGTALFRPPTAVANRRSLFKGIAIATACLWLAIALIVPPFVASSFPAYQLFQQSRDYLRPEMKFCSVSFNEPSLVWYFRSRVDGFLTSLNNRRAVDFMAQAGPRLVIVPTSLATKLFPDHPENWKMFSTRGFNIVKGENVELTLLLKPE
jgi:4-amino-4-deoxy-L-arabinose transferase-like glycosyltransferase